MKASPQQVLEESDLVVPGPIHAGSGAYRSDLLSQWLLPGGSPTFRQRIPCHQQE